MKRIVILWSLVTIGFATTSSGQEQNVYMVYGEGTSSCGRWLATPAPDDDPMLQWVLGYVTAGSYYVANIWNATLTANPELAAEAEAYCDQYPAALLCQNQIVKNTDANAVSAWLSQYCVDHPLEDLDDASRALIAVLGEQ